MNAIVASVVAAVPRPEEATTLADRERSHGAGLERLAQAAESQDDGEDLSLLSRAERGKRLFE
jgi:hypothetical protein